MKTTHIFLNRIVLLSGLLISQLTVSSEPLALQSEFHTDEVKWVLEKGDSSVQGTAALRLKNGTIKNCSGSSVELLPVANYSNERIFKTYGNNDSGQVLLEDNPPKFTPDAKEYHDLVLKSSCNEKGEFTFNDVHSGDYYVIAFIIWDTNKNGATSKTGGAVMKRIKVKATSKNKGTLKN